LGDGIIDLISEEGEGTEITFSIYKNINEKKINSEFNIIESF
jgi:hypothetical protein